MSLQICAPVSVIRNEKPNNSNNTCPYKTAKVRHLPQQIQSLSAQPPLPNVKHALVEWIEQNLFAATGRWNDRRLIIFTQWEDTRIWLEKRLKEAFGDTDRNDERIAT